MNSASVRLFSTSASIMLLELICIRWIPAYIRLFGFFINFVLLGSLLGVGVGMLAQKKLGMSRFPLLLLALMAFVELFQFSFNVPTAQMLFYGAENAVEQHESFLLLPAVFCLVAVVFVPLGGLLGELLGAFAPLRAYWLDILGSLVGIAAFTFLSYLSTPPWVWFLVLGVAAAPLFPVADRRFAAVAFAGILIAASAATLLSPLGDNVWSPYYRIQYRPNPEHNGYFINVNNIGHQYVQPYQTRETFYFRPYDLLGTPPYKNVLIIGAGTGTDVATALHQGVEHVDAVEIDPQLYRLGRALSPDHPYDDPRVTVHVNDGRAFLRHTSQKYDLIIFALTDSLTLTSGYANLRLESFLFTVDSIREAKAHLSDDGVLVLYNYYREDWSIRKLAGMMESAFGTPPFVTAFGISGKAAVFMEGPRLVRLDPALDKPFALGDVMQGRGAALPGVGEGRLGGEPDLTPASDDWPFFYLRQPGVPSVYIGALAMVVAIAVAMVWFCSPRGTLARFTPGFFFLGAAFMLLEARSLVVFALLFGTTWIVNAMVFFAILTSVLLAVTLASRWHIRRLWPLYLLLLALLAANYLVPIGSFLEFGSDAGRYIAVAIFVFAPILVANLIFTAAFAETATASVSFAYNLFGIMFGGMFEYAALAIGYRNLIPLVVLFYTLAFVASRWRGTPSGVSATGSAR